MTPGRRGYASSKPTTELAPPPRGPREVTQEDQARLQMNEAETAEPEHLRQVIVRMPREMHAAIKEKAAKSDLTMSQVVRAAVRAHLNDPRLSLPG